MLKYVNSLCISKNLCTFAAVNGTQSQSHNIYAASQWCSKSIHIHIAIWGHIQVTTCHIDGLGIVVPVGDT